MAETDKKNGLPEIYTDKLTRTLYANDASMYEELPYGVSFPADGDEMVRLIQWAKQNKIPITARSAGTSLAGQTTGGGLVMDVSRHLTEILEIDAGAQTAHVQPGVIRDTLNREAAKYGLLFGPDTSTTNRCMIGGMIGNNSTGSFSIKYGSTRDHILNIEAILSDGSRAVFGPLTEAGLEEKKKLDSLEGKIYRGMCDLIEKNRDAIIKAYPHPEIVRRNTGYALDRLCMMKPFNKDDSARVFNMAEFLCGSEGTLAMTVGATVKLVKADPYKILVIPQFNDLDEAMLATVEAVKYQPAAVELVDDIILDATKTNIEQRRNRFFLQGEPKCLLIVQFDGHDMDQLQQKAAGLKEVFAKKGFGYACSVIREPDKMERVWELRKAGLGLLMGVASDDKTPTFCEDTAVHVNDLPEYVKQFRKLMDKYETSCVFYAHASVGELHLRPVLNLKTPDGLAKMKAMASEIADLVHSFGGSLSGEHGDGRARAPFIEKILGPDMLKLLKQVKDIWDPGHLFNPGKIVDAKPMDTDLRYSPAYRTPEVDTVFRYRGEGSFSAAVEQCNGAGVCRKLSESGGTMCPSYMATREEKDTTRGRANLFRQLFSGMQNDAFSSEELHEALDLCLMCKGCKNECPANVDMARLKSEFLNGWHKRKGVSVSERFFAEPERLYPAASRFPGTVNWMNRRGVTKFFLKHMVHIHPERNLPSFAPETFEDWYKLNQQTNGNDGLNVVLLIDIFTNYHEPEIGKDALKVLEAAGYSVRATKALDVGRTRISKGLLDGLQTRVHSVIDYLYPLAERGDAIVGLEPSEVLTLRDEYLDLCGDEYLDKAKKIADQAYLFEEFLGTTADEQPEEFMNLFRSDNQEVYVHGHCHAKALTGIDPLLKLFQNAGLAPIDLKTGCCGMAGSFGYETKHYDVSMRIGELKLFPSLRGLPDNTLIGAPGFSCRHQIKDGVGLEAKHPATILAGFLKNQK